MPASLPHYMAFLNSEEEFTKESASHRSDSERQFISEQQWARDCKEGFYRHIYTYLGDMAEQAMFLHYKPHLNYILNTAHLSPLPDRYVKEKIANEGAKYGNEVQGGGVMSQQDDLDKLDEMCDPFQLQHDQAIALADARFKQATLVEKQRYDQISESAWETYQQTKSRAATKNEIKTAFDAYKAVKDTAWLQYLRNTNPARTEQMEAYKAADIKLNEDIEVTTLQWRMERDGELE